MYWWQLFTFVYRCFTAVPALGCVFAAVPLPRLRSCCRSVDKGAVLNDRFAVGMAGAYHELASLVAGVKAEFPEIAE